MKKLFINMIVINMTFGNVVHQNVEEWIFISTAAKDQ